MLILVASLIGINIYAWFDGYDHFIKTSENLNISNQSLNNVYQDLIVKKVKDKKIQINQDFNLKDKLDYLVILIPMTHYNSNNQEHSYYRKNEIFSNQKNTYDFLYELVEKKNKIHVLVEGKINTDKETEYSLDPLNNTRTNYSDYSFSLSETQSGFNKLLIEGTASFLIDELNSFFNNIIENNVLKFIRVSDQDRVLSYGAEPAIYSTFNKNNDDIETEVKKINIRNMFFSSLIKRLVEKYKSENPIIIYQVGRTHLLNKSSVFSSSNTIPSYLKTIDVNYLILCTHYDNNYCLDK